jgi:hypothetical protein
VRTSEVMTFCAMLALTLFRVPDLALAVGKAGK